MNFISQNIICKLAMLCVTIQTFPSVHTGNQQLPPSNISRQHNMVVKSIRLELDTPGLASEPFGLGQIT